MALGFVQVLCEGKTGLVPRCSSIIGKKIEKEGGRTAVTTHPTSGLCLIARGSSGIQRVYASNSGPIPALVGVHRLTVLERILEHQRPQPGKLSCGQRWQFNMRGPFLASHSKVRRFGLILRRILVSRVACGEERSECGHGIRDERDTSFHFQPEQHPDHIVLTIFELVTTCSDDVGDDGKDTKTQK